MATSKKAGGAKAAYTVVSPLIHGVLDEKGNSVETKYLPGEEVELSEAEAEPLLGHTVTAKPRN